MSENVALIRRARQQLSGIWVNVSVGSLVYLALMSVAGATSFLELIVYGPLTFGFYLFLACNIDTHVNNLNLLFKGFERFVDTLVAGLIMSIAVGLGLILLIVPGIIVSCGLALTFFIMVDDPNISGTEALNQSWNMMRGHKWEIFCLWCRFLGWILLSVFTCGIGFIFVTPYMVAATQNFYRKLRYGTF